MTASLPTLSKSPVDLAEWTTLLSAPEIPVLAQTADALEEMRAREDDVDASQIGEMVLQDPLMTLKLLVYASTHRGEKMVTDTETVTATLVMIGITPFFRAFGPQPTVQGMLAGKPQALTGLLDTVERAYRSARFAASFAVHRQDHDAAVIQEAALLHDFTEMLLWCHAPSLALTMRQAQERDTTLRSNVIQREVLNIELLDLQQALMKIWRLPALLIDISDDAHAKKASVRNVSLAVRLARHSAQGWHNAAIPDDVAELAELLNLSPVATREFIDQIEPAQVSEVEVVYELS